MGRSSDPWAPRPRNREPETPPTAGAPAGGQSVRGFVQAPAEHGGADLQGLRKADLVQLAEQQGLDTDGTRAELIERLTAAGA